MNQQEKIEQELAKLEQVKENLFDLWVDNGSNFNDELMEVRRTVCAASTRLQEVYESVKTEVSNKTEVPIA